MQAEQEKEQARDYFEQAYAQAQAIDLRHVVQSASSALQQLSGNLDT